MTLSRPFILRPIATSLLMIGLLLAGLVAYQQLPISALPQVDYPTIQITTFYPGAGPDVIGSSITAPLERTFVISCVLSGLIGVEIDPKVKHKVTGEKLGVGRALECWDKQRQIWICPTSCHPSFRGRVVSISISKSRGV